MTPEQRIADLEKRLTALERVENIPFIQNIERRAGSGIKSGIQSVTTTIDQAVRNSADTGSVTVPKQFDFKLKVTLSDGSTKYIGGYNS
jgi:hypothetical protein